MSTSRRMFLKIGSGLAATVYWNSGSGGAQLALEGEVLRKDNTPIESVLVTAYRGAAKIGEATTLKDGKYSIKFDSGVPVDTVRYEQTAYVSGVVNDLCGARKHSISKTLYLRRTKLDLFESLESLSSLERIFYIDTESKVSSSSLKDRYVPMLVEFKDSLPKFPPSLSERLLAVMKLYEMA